MYVTFIGSEEARWLVHSTMCLQPIAPPLRGVLFLSGSTLKPILTFLYADTRGSSSITEGTKEVEYVKAYVD